MNNVKKTYGDEAALAVYREVEGSRPFQAMPEFIKRLIEYLLKNTPVEDKVELSAADTEFFVALNQYLTEEGSEGLALPNQLPPDFMASLMILLDGKQLNLNEHVFNTGPDALERGQSSEKMARLGAFFRALSNYYVQSQNVAPEEPDIKLWKLVVRNDAEGYLRREMVEVDHIDAANERATLIAPGISFTHEKKEQLLVQARLMEMSLGGKAIHELDDDKPITIYAMSYSKKDRMAYAADTYASNADPRGLIKPCVQRFVDQVVMPSVGLDKEEAKLNPAQLRSKLRHLRLYSFSYGSVMVLQMRNAITKWLQEKGYSDETIRQALPAVFSLNVMPTCTIEEELPETGSFSSIYSVAPGDLTAESRMNFRRLIPPDSMDGNGERPLNPQTLLCWRDIPEAGINVTWLKHMEHPKDLSRIKMPSHIAPQPKHSPPLMMMDIYEPSEKSAGTLYRSKGLSDSLRRALTASELPANLTEMLKPYSLIEDADHQDTQQPKPPDKGKA